MIIIDVSIGIDGIPSEKTILLGNKYENNDTIVNFDLPADFDTYKKYIITVNRNTTRIFPLTDDRLVVSSALTELAGNWAMYLMCRESTIDLSVDNPDISAKENEHVFISDGFIGTVADIQIDRRLVEFIPMDTNLKIAYDDLMDLKAELLARIAGIDEYYTKTDTNTNDIAQIKEDLAEVKPNVVSGGSNYGEVAVWDDGNPNSEDRLYRFVTVVGDNREVDIANSISQIVGTSNIKANVGFLGNYTKGAENDTTKTIVSILGVSYVKTHDNTIMPNDQVMSDNNGYAVKSTNNLGYRVLKVVEPGLLEIIVSPNSDMIQRIKTNMESKVDELKGEIANIGNPTDEQVSTAVNNYLDKNPVSGLDASTAQENQVPTADGQGNWSWKTQQSGTGSEETDPTVPNWAKQPNKPTYTASEVGALPNTTKIPSKTSDLQNDRGFLTEHQDLSGYALKSEVPKSASDVGADASGTAESKVSEHNISDTAHNDIRLLIQGLTERLNALANSDDETLDQMNEVAAYIKSNKSLIDAITTSKVSVSDIIDNLTTNVSNKPLSAAQGVALKTLIDAISVPTKLSELENDRGFLTEHQVNDLIDAKLTGVETLLGGGF